MAYFLKNAGLVKTAYKSDVKFGSVELGMLGKALPQSYGLDGFSLVTVNVGTLPQGTEDFLGGNLAVTTLVIPESVSELKCNIGALFPNLTKIIIGKSDALMTDTDALYTGLDLANDVVFYVNDSLKSAYETAHPSRQYVAWSDVVEWTIPYIGNTELTVDYVEEVVAGLPASMVSAIEKVIVPVDFTSYESGSITAIQNAFTNMEHLVTCYEAGNIDLDMNGDVVAKIVEIGKTLDEALCYARTLSLSPNGSKQNNASIIIVPPIVVSDTSLAYGGSGRGKFYGCNNIVLVADLKAPNLNINSVWAGYFMADVFTSSKLVELNATFTNTQNVPIVMNFCNSEVKKSLKRVNISFSPGTYSDSGFLAWANSSKLESIVLNGCTSRIIISDSTLLTRQALIDLINSLGTPDTTQTLAIGAINLAKLTNADIQLAYDKNWALSPTPANFSLTISGTTYSVAFGTTFATFVSNNSTDFQIIDGIVYNMAGTQVLIASDGNIAMPNKLVRGGETYAFDTMPTLSTLTIPYVDNTTLTKAYVDSVVEAQADKMAIGKVVVSSSFTSYESGALDAIFAQFTNMSEIESPWLNGNTTDGFEYTIPYAGNSTLTASYVSGLVSGDPTTFASTTKVVVPSNFTSFEQNALQPYANLSYLEYGIATLSQLNGNFLPASLANTDVVVNASASINALRWADFNKCKSLKLDFLASSVVIDSDNCLKGTATERVVLHGNIASINGNYNFAQNAKYPRLYLDTSNLVTAGGSSVFYNNSIKLYVHAANLVHYLTASGWSSITTHEKIGYLDYTDTIPSFSGYTDQWYEDEDCTVPVLPENFVSGNRYYVKLTPLITFTIGGQSYNATPSMTWTQWVASAYNTIGFAISNNIVTDGGSHGVSTTIMGQNWVDPSATISATDYYLVAI